jgi:hypothetical protein
MSFFQDNGDPLPGVRFGDPYRDRPGSGTVGGDHFDSDGYPTPELLRDAERVCRAGTAHPTSCAARVYHAEQFANKTKGNYSACYMWR